jgi:glycosyltransferase involved in cell wall biosynthesis
MRILHLSDTGLPDWRIEKSALTGIKHGNEVAFAGGPVGDATSGPFNKFFLILWTAKARMGIPYYRHVVKKQIQRILEDFRPDIIHAHNIAAAKLISDSKCPFVYDDHEYWSQHAKLLIEIEREARIERFRNGLAEFIQNIPMMLRRVLINRYCVSVWSSWERDIVSMQPTITVSHGIANDLRAIGRTNKVFVVPNFPLAEETAEVTIQPHTHLSSVYAGKDGPGSLKYPHRNIDGLVEMFESRGNIGSLSILGWTDPKRSQNVHYAGFLPRKEMFAEMSRHSIGLLPWKKHWQHEFVSPNKVYEYAHAGLHVLCTSSLKEVRTNLRDNCMTFDSYEDMAAALEYLSGNMEVVYQKRRRTLDFARANLLWEKFEEEILRAYSIC